MKKIEAVIRPERLDKVCAALEKVGYPGLMITEITGHGKQRGITQQWRGKEYKVEFLPKTKVEVVVKDQDLKKTLEAIREATYTGEVGDGKIFVSAVEDVFRIRTAERGDVAV